MFLEWNPNEYELSARGVVITLLAKEYALLDFLYQNRGQAFTREQLLDKVWPMEYPTERTVDDHIYRLRKRLVPFEELKLETVRGIGYKLRVDTGNASTALPPSAADAQLREALNEILTKYHRYGQGKSLLALARQQDVLGYELDGFYRIYVHFVQGDLNALLDNRIAPLKERLYWLLLIHLLTCKATNQVSLCEEVLEKNILSVSQRKELYFLNMLDVYTIGGMPEKALARLPLSYEMIKEPDFNSFRLPVQISELYARLAAGEDDGALEELAQTIEQLVEETPYYREKGSFCVVNGLRLLCRGEQDRGCSMLDEGLRLLKESGFVPLRLAGLSRIIHFTRQLPLPSQSRIKYRAMFDEELDAMGFTDLAPRLIAEIRKALLPV